MHKGDKKSKAVANGPWSPFLLPLLLCCLCTICGFLGGRLYEQKYMLQTLVRLGDVYGPRASQGVADAFNVPHKDISLSEPGLKVKGTTGKRGEGICVDTCTKANNGVCDDGRLVNGSAPISELSVFCDLGTDCSDCGVWHAPNQPVTKDWMEGNGPIGQLVKKNVKVFVKRMVTKPSFIFAYTDKDTDFDVSYYAYQYSGVELGTTMIFYKILRDRCAADPNALFVDVGANFGWFALYVAKLGCRVLAFEPVPRFRWFLEYSLALNGLSHKVELRSEVVSEQGGTTMEMVVPTRGIWGTAGIGGANIDSSIESQYEKLSVPSVRLDDVVHSDVALLKVDVEGWEWSVMKGAGAMMRKHNVEHVIMEYSPGVAERKRDWVLLRKMVMMLVDFLQLGYTMANIPEGEKGMITHDWDVPLRTVAEVTMKNLKYDLEDIRIEMETGKLGCPTPPELAKYPAWAACDAIPEDLHPKSFRSQLSHNTNLWLSKNRTALPLAGVVGVFPIDRPTNLYFSERPDKLSTGLRHCEHLAPQYQLRHRCHCTKPEVCGEEERIVLDLIKHGKMPVSYDI